MVFYVASIQWLYNILTHTYKLILDWLEAHIKSNDP